MTKRRKKYDKEFKERTVELSKNRNNISDLARELGILPVQLHRWRKEQKEFGTGSFPGSGNVKQTPEQERISALEKKLKDTELERDILKKAIGIFSKYDR